jgi:hypothetical protein
MATEDVPTGTASPTSGDSEQGAILAALERIERRLDRLERQADKAESTAEQTTAAFAAFTDTADEIVADAQNRGVDFDERLRAGAQLLERLTAPATMQALQQLCTLVEQAPGAVAMFGDVIDETFSSLAERGIDVDERLRSGLHALEQLTSTDNLATLHELLQRMDAFRDFLASGVLDRGPLTLVSKAGAAFAEVAQSEGRGVGPFGTLRAMSNKDVQQTMGLAVRFAERLGTELRSGQFQQELPSDSNGSSGAGPQARLPPNA